MNLSKESDGRLLWGGVYLEEQSALRFLEMNDAFQVTDEPSAKLFRQLSREEESHRDRLAEHWKALGSPRIPGPDVQAWLGRKYPSVLEPWDRDDDDLKRALDRVLAIEKAAEDFHRHASKATRDPRLSELFDEIAAEELAHQGDIRGMNTTGGETE